MLSPSSSHLPLAVALACGAAVVHAQDKPADYPLRPVRVVVGIGPGGGLDLMTRLGAQKIAERWNQSVIVDNRAGGGTVIGMDIVAAAPNDGYTLLGASETLMLNGVLGRAAYDIRTAFVPIVQICAQNFALVVTPTLPVKSVRELIDYAKVKSGALAYGSQGLGTTGHLAMEHFKLLTGADIVHVPYKSAAAALVEVMSNQVQLMFASTVSSTQHIRSGRLRAIATSGLRRAPNLPELPTVAEGGISGFDWGNSYNLLAPAGTPPRIVRAINAVVRQGVNTPDTIKSLAADGSEPAPPMTPEEFKIKFNADYARLEKLIKSINVRIQ
jgi:tripartite-type tricarboxylate transporter receptor subunit TctC